MNLDRDDIEIEEVLYRYFQQELTAAERSEVEAWRARSPENQRLFDETKIMLLDLKGMAYYKSTEPLEVDQSWEKFKTDHKVKDIRTPPPRSFTFLKYAASIVIIASAVFGIYYYQNRVEEVTIAGTDQVEEINLQDGSLISLNAGAHIEYPQPFQNEERRLKLAGEAYFEVERIPKKPFVVEVGDAEVRVLGTKFFINRPNEKDIHVQVVEGKVLVSYKDLHQIIGAGKSVTLDLQNERLTKTKDEAGLTSFWKTRRLVFRLTSLADVIDVVNEAYNTSVRLEGSTEGCALTVTFDNEEFENVLEVISSTLNYELTGDQGAYILKGNGCQ